MAKISKADWHDIHNPKRGQVARLRKIAGPKLVAQYGRTEVAQRRAVVENHKTYWAIVEKLGSEKKALTLMMALDTELPWPP